MGNKRQILPKDDAVYVEHENQMVILLKVEGFWGALLARHARWIRNISTGYPHCEDKGKKDASFIFATKTATNYTIG